MATCFGLLDVIFRLLLKYIINNVLYLILLSQILKVALSKPKHVAMFCYIFYIIKVWWTKIILFLITEKYTTGMSHLKNASFK
jgi:hypothetical protein